jgi:hypothetical protein
MNQTEYILCVQIFTYSTTHMFHCTCNPCCGSVFQFHKSVIFLSPLVTFNYRNTKQRDLENWSRLAGPGILQVSCNREFIIEFKKLIIQLHPDLDAYSPYSYIVFRQNFVFLIFSHLIVFFISKIFCFLQISILQGGSNMTGTDCGLFTHKSVPVIFEPPCIFICNISAVT